MNRKHLQQLRVHTGPALTIICACDQESIKKTINTAEKLLVEKHEVELIEQLYFAQKGLLCPKQKQQKIAIFIDIHRTLSFLVPNDVPEIIKLSSSFIIDPIAISLCHKKRFWVIDCTNNYPVLREGYDNFINELAAECVTAVHECPIGTKTEFCFDRCLGQYLESDQLPIILVGTAEKSAYFNLIAPYQEKIIGHVATIEEAAPAFTGWYTAQTEQFLQKINTGHANLDFITDIHQLLEFSYQGHIKTLLIEEHYQHTICQHRLTGKTIESDHCPLGFENIDLVEKLLLNICAKGGELFFVPDGSLTKYGHMAAFVIELFLEDTLKT